MLDYADNPDKTTPQRYLDSDLYNALKYAANDAKTDRTMFVGGINCSKQNAYGEMVAVQKRFGSRGSVVAYHGIQSFRAGEVTPEMAFEIGKETARRMWGDRYQVLVTVHLNTENVHCHFVVNPVSFQDGSKFQNKIGDHKELRKISDAICREHGLSVLENSDFYKHEKKAYWLHRQGKKTHRDALREDVEYCLTYAKNWEQFEKQMVSRGYFIDRVRLSVKAAKWQRSVRLSSLGYPKEVLRSRFDEHFYSNDFRQKWNTHLPYKPKRFPLEWEMDRLAFTIEHSHNTEEVFVDTVLLLLILVMELVLQTTDVMLLSPDLRAAAKDLESYRAFYRKTEFARSPSWKPLSRTSNPRLMYWKRNAVKLTTSAAGQRHRRNVRRPKTAKRNSPRKLRRCGRSYGRQKRFWRNPHMYTNCCKKNTAWNRRHIKDSEKG